jgi:cell division protein FtsB
MRHQREESLLKHDPEYVGMIARDRLDLMQEGETIYRIGAPPASSRRPN